MGPSIRDQLVFEAILCGEVWNELLEGRTQEILYEPKLDARLGVLQDAEDRRRAKV